MAESDQPAGVGVDRGVRPRTPKGVVAVLVGSDGIELANAADFSTGSPAGFSRRDYQESMVRRALAMATMRALASPRLSDAIEPYTAEQIVRAMCNSGCRIVIVPVGYEE